MNALSKLVLSLASIATLGATASAATLAPIGDGPIERGPIGDGPIERGPIERGPIERAPLPDACPANKKASASKTFSFFPGQNEAGLTWNFGFSATPALTADCDKLSADLGFGAVAKWGPISVTPFSVVLSGSTDKNHKNSVAIKYLTFGFKVHETTIASGTAAIDFTKNMDLVLPGTTGAKHWEWSWMHEFDIPGPNLTAQVKAKADVVALGGLFATAEISSTGIRSSLLSSATAYADASGSVSINGVAVTGGTRLDLFWYAVGAHANLLPKNGGFNADIGYSISARDVLGAHLSFDIPLYGRYTVFELTPADYGDDFTYSKDFTKGF
jgi:hypothetical protein